MNLLSWLKTLALGAAAVVKLAVSKARPTALLVVGLCHDCQESRKTLLARKPGPHASCWGQLLS